MDRETYDKIMRTGAPVVTSAALTLNGALLKPPVPSKIGALGFGGALALGAWMIYDSDYKNGAGFTSVWSTLYLMTNAKKMRGGYARMLGLLATFNAVAYAVEFVRTPPAGTKRIEFRTSRS